MLENNIRNLSKAELELVSGGFGGCCVGCGLPPTRIPAPFPIPPFSAPPLATPTADLSALADPGPVSDAAARIFLALAAADSGNH